MVVRKWVCWEREHGLKSGHVVERSGEEHRAWGERLLETEKAVGRSMVCEEVQWSETFFTCESGSEELHVVGRTAVGNEVCVLGQWSITRVRGKGRCQKLGVSGVGR